jgi:molybdopterin-guanine dinucleotide biosynthesis protein A
MVGFQCVIVAGGRATRLGGIDKGSLRDGDGSLVDRALRASAGASAVALVGRGTAPGRVLRVEERPRFGGPVAALAAGLDALGDRSSWTLVLAGDLPHVERAVPPLLAAVGGVPAGEGAVAIDLAGRRQPLLAVYRTAALRGALGRLGEAHGASMRALLHPLALSTVALGDRLCADVDTPADVLRHGLHEPSGRAHVA